MRRRFATIRRFRACRTERRCSRHAPRESAICAPRHATALRCRDAREKMPFRADYAMSATDVECAQDVMLQGAMFYRALQRYAAC